MNTDKLFKQFRKQVKLKLARHEITARQLADELGISPQNLNNRFLGKVSDFETTKLEIETALKNLIPK